MFRYRCAMSGNPFQPEGGNPFEGEDGPNNPANNPFEDEDEIDDILIPTLDEDLDRVVSNPFQSSDPVSDPSDPLSDPSDPMPETLIDDETTKLIENVNLTYRARTDEAVIASLPKSYFNDDEQDMVKSLLIQLHNQSEISNQKKLIENIHEMKVINTYSQITTHLRPSNANPYRNSHN